jgi:formylglycine-generating enzyme required for sulfatase activity
MANVDPLGLVGSTIADKYAVQAMVGEGGFAVVYRAEHLVWKRPVAVKVFKSLDLPPDDRARLVEEFLREGALLADLSERSSAIVQARDVGSWTPPRGEPVPYMVLEWLEGKTLDDLLEGERARGTNVRTLHEALLLLEPVAEALTLAHERGIAHRDVKPANVFILNEGGGAKLLDFGIAKVVQEAQARAGAFQKTGGQATSFTPLYGAPEQFNRGYGATGPWTDVYALALMLGEVLSGRLALDGDDLMQLAFASCNTDKRPTPQTLGVAVPAAVEAVFLRALAVRTSDRYQNAGEFWAALTSGMRESSANVPLPVAHADTMVAPSSARDLLPSPAAAQGTPDAAPAPSSKGAVIGVFVALVLAAGATGAGFWAFGEGGGLGHGAHPGSASAVPSAMPSATPSAAASVPVVPKGQCPEGMTRIPGGDFFMGSDIKGALDNEKPVHPVSLAPYCLDVTEVTTAKYAQCVAKGTCLRALDNRWPAPESMTAAQQAAYDPLCNLNQPAERGAHPINCVGYQQAVDYCAGLGARLPTEAEWEFAARGSDGRTYPWGEAAPGPELLNACGAECLAWGKANKIELSAMYKGADPFETTAPVGSFRKGATVYGIMDMVGNVWEWVADWYGPYAAGAGRIADPQGPPSGEQRVIRGGAWNASEASWVRPTFRYRDAPEKRSYGIGFRCARTL